MSSLCLSCHTTDSSLDVRVEFDHQLRWQGKVNMTPQLICFDFDDHDGVHHLMIELSGKTHQHTQLDSAGTILRDSNLKIEKFSLLGVTLDDLLRKHSRYHHDFNGTQPPIQDEFYGLMGCNGQLHLRWQGTAYQWMLNNLEDF